MMRLGYPSLLLTLSVCLQLAAQAQAAPLSVPANLAAAPPRDDPGTGLCVSAIHLSIDNVFQSYTDAVNRFPLVVGAGGIDKKVTVATPVPAAQLRNADLAALGDFVGSGVQSYFPFSAFSGAPSPGNDKNFAVRLRGYLSVPRPGTITLGVNAQAGFRLLIANLIVNASVAPMSGRYTKQVEFSAAGLYALELIHYTNSGPAVLELSQADSAQPEVSGSPTSLSGTYQLVPSARLYTALAGQSGDCVECSADTGCVAGSYCGSNSLCQPCLTDARCGSQCQPCGNGTLCLAGKCVECTAARDALCALRGLVCQPNNTCGGCASSAQCKIVGDVCRQDKTCGKCQVDVDCGGGKICIASACVPPICTAVDPTPCTSQALVCDTTTSRCASCTADAQCAADGSLVCDLNVGRCVKRRGLDYLGGCRVGRGGVAGADRPPVGGPAALGLLALGLLIVLRRGRQRRTARAAGSRSGRRGVEPGAGESGRAAHRGVLLVIIASLGIGTPGLARAQFQSGTALSANAQTFQPALGPHNVVTVEGTRTPEALTPMVGLTVDYAVMLLRLYDQDYKRVVANTVPSMVTAHVQAGLGITRFLSAGVVLPLVVSQGFDPQASQFDPRVSAPSGFGLGDLRAVVKLRILNNTRGGVGLAFVPQASFPTGDGTQFRGDGGYGILPRAALDYRTRGGMFTIALNVGFLVRTNDQTVGSTLISHQARYGLGMGLSLPKGFGVGGEVVGAAGISTLDSASATRYLPLSGYMNASWAHSSGFQVSVGGGGSLLGAVTEPQYRVFGGIGYLPMESPWKRRPAKAVDAQPGQRLVLWKPTEEKALPTPDQGADKGATGSGKEAGKPQPTQGPTAVATGPTAPRGPTEVTPTGPVKPTKGPTPVGPDGAADAGAGPAAAPGEALVEVDGKVMRLKQPLRFTADSSELSGESAPVVEAIAKAVSDDPSIVGLTIAVSASGDKRAAAKLAAARVKGLRTSLIGLGVAKKKIKIKAGKVPGEDQISQIGLARGKVKAPVDKAGKADKAKKGKRRAK